MNVIGQLLPVDGYYVSVEEALPMNYINSLTHLYQPLIGPEALMLYQTLLNDFELQDENPQTHHSLMNYLTIPLDRIYKARLKLEGIGLLKTYKLKNDSATVYTYELQTPYSPMAFFEDAMLSTLLYHHVGEVRFHHLQKHFTKQARRELVGKQITADFQEVFQTITPEENRMPLTSSSLNTEDDVVEEEFQWLEQMLKQRMIPVNKVLTKENRKLISQMQVLYDLETFEIDKAVLWALSDENVLDEQEFKFACHDIFKANNHNKPIRLMNKQENIQRNEDVKKPQTKEEILIQELETISPKQLLEDLSSGNHAAETDMKAIREVMTTQGLPAPVMNVLIHYVLLQTNMKLSKAYLEKIASQWSRAGLKTAKEAMEFAKKEKERFEQSRQKRPTYYQKQKNKDIVPDWYKKGAHKQSKPMEKTQEKMSEEQERIANLIKQYSEGN